MTCMHDRFPVRGLLLILSLLAPVSSAVAQHELTAEGRIDIVYSAAEANGLAQSPINVITSQVIPGHHDIALHYGTSHEHLVNTGHTIEADFDEGSYLEYDGLVYKLRQLHFHTPSEHQIDGLTYPMELHMVHTLDGDPGRYLVIGVLFRMGGENAFVERVLEHAPRQAGEEYEANLQLSAGEILSSVDGYYHYEGSLTTPPYSETVTWLLMRDIHEADSRQIQALNQLEGNNARHIQQLHVRRVEVE